MHDIVESVAVGFRRPGWAPPPSSRDQMISAGVRLFDEGGREAVTLRALGKAVGLTHTALFRHFKDKQDLLRAIAKASFAEMNAALETASQKGASPLEALKLVAAEYLNFARRYPARYRLMVADPAVKESDGAGATAFGVFLTLASHIHAAQEAGELQDGETAPMTMLLLGAIHGVAEFEHRLPNANSALAGVPFLLLDRMANRRGD